MGTGAPHSASVRFFVRSVWNYHQLLTMRDKSPIVGILLSGLLLPTLFLAAQSESPLREKEILRFREEVRQMVDANDTLGLLAQNRSDGESLVSALKKSPRTPEDLNFLKARYQEMQERINYYLDQMANDIAAIGGTDDDANNFFTFQKMLKRHYAGNYEKALADYQMFMRYAHGPGEVPFFPPIAIHELVSRIGLSGNAPSEKTAILAETIRSWKFRDWGDI